MPEDSLKTNRYLIPFMTVRWRSDPTLVPPGLPCFICLKADWACGIRDKGAQEQEDCGLTKTSDWEDNPPLATKQKSGKILQ